MVPVILASKLALFQQRVDVDHNKEMSDLHVLSLLLLGARYIEQ